MVDALKEKIMSKDKIVWSLIKAWIKHHVGPLATPNYCLLKNDLYQARNPGFNGLLAISHWPAHLISSDAEVMAAVEHYFLARCWVGTDEQPAWQMRAMSAIYNAGKHLGVTPQHNPNNPVTPPSALQSRFQEEGITAGEADLVANGGSAPVVASPPTY